MEPFLPSDNDLGDDAFEDPFSEEIANEIRETQLNMRRAFPHISGEHLVGSVEEDDIGLDEDALEDFLASDEVSDDENNEVEIHSEPKPGAEIRAQKQGKKPLRAKKERRLADLARDIGISQVEAALIIYHPEVDLLLKEYYEEYFDRNFEKGVTPFSQFEASVAIIEELGAAHFQAANASDREEWQEHEWKASLIVRMAMKLASSSSQVLSRANMSTSDLYDYLNDVLRYRRHNRRQGQAFEDSFRRRIVFAYAKGNAKLPTKEPPGDWKPPDRPPITLKARLGMAFTKPSKGGSKVLTTADTTKVNDGGISDNSNSHKAGDASTANEASDDHVGVDEDIAMPDATDSAQADSASKVGGPAADDASCSKPEDRRKKAIAAAQEKAKPVLAPRRDPNDTYAKRYPDKQRKALNPDGMNMDIYTDNDFAVDDEGVAMDGYNLYTGSYVDSLLPEEELIRRLGESCIDPDVITVEHLKLGVCPYHSFLTLKSMCSTAKGKLRQQVLDEQEVVQANEEEAAMTGDLDSDCSDLIPIVEQLRKSGARQNKLQDWLRDQTNNGALQPQDYMAAAVGLRVTSTRKPRILNMAPHKTLHWWQLVGAWFLKQMSESKVSKAVVLADGVGLGKTYTLLTYWLHCINERTALREKGVEVPPPKPFLFLVPANLLMQTHDAVRDFSTHFKVVTSHGDTRVGKSGNQKARTAGQLLQNSHFFSNDEINARTVIVMSYTTFSGRHGIGKWREEIREMPAFANVRKGPWDKAVTENRLFGKEMKILEEQGPHAKLPWNLAGKFDKVALDEAHSFRNVNSTINKSLCNLDAQELIEITGTPVFNHSNDIQGLIKIGQLASAVDDYDNGIHKLGFKLHSNPYKFLANTVETYNDLKQEDRNRLLAMCLTSLAFEHWVMGSGPCDRTPPSEVDQGRCLRLIYSAIVLRRTNDSRCGNDDRTLIRNYIPRCEKAVIELAYDDDAQNVYKVLEAQLKKKLVSQSKVRPTEMNINSRVARDLILLSTLAYIGYSHFFMRRVKSESKTIQTPPNFPKPGRKNESTIWLYEFLFNIATARDETRTKRSFSERVEAAKGNRTALLAILFSWSPRLKALAANTATQYYKYQEKGLIWVTYPLERDLIFHMLQVMGLVNVGRVFAEDDAPSREAKFKLFNAPMHKRQPAHMNTTASDLPEEEDEEEDSENAAPSSAIYNDEVSQAVLDQVPDSIDWMVLTCVIAGVGHNLQKANRNVHFLSVPPQYALLRQLLGRTWRLHQSRVTLLTEYYQMYTWASEQTMAMTRRALPDFFAILAGGDDSHGRESDHAMKIPPFLMGWYSTARGEPYQFGPMVHRDDPRFKELIDENSKELPFDHVMKRFLTFERGITLNQSDGLGNTDLKEINVGSFDIISEKPKHLHGRIDDTPKKRGAQSDGDQIDGGKRLFNLQEAQKLVQELRAALEPTFRTKITLEAAKNIFITTSTSNEFLAEDWVAIGKAKDESEKDTDEESI